MALRRLFIASLGFVCLAAASAGAQSLTDLHDKVRVGNKLCFSDHYHDGNSSGHKSRDAAETAAVRSWQDFTAWEYGRAWGDFWIAANRGIKCEQSGGSWGCHVQAKACRRR